MKFNNNLVIITDATFPYGMAATNRIMSYGTGFIKNGAEITVISFGFRELCFDINESKVRGIYKNIKYEYTTKRLGTPANRLMSKIYNVIGLIKAGILLNKIHREKKVDAVILYSKSLIGIIYFFLITKFLFIIYLKEESEFPEAVLNNRNIFQKVRVQVLTKYSYRLFDGLLVMTKTLIEYFMKKVNESTKILHVPMTVDVDRFIDICDNNFNKLPSEYIAFSGYLGWNLEGVNKDGVQVLIKAFKIVSEKFDDVKLVIVGFTNSEKEYLNLKKIVSDLTLDGKIIFTGRIRNDAIPEILCKAKVLAMARPNSLQAKGAFPTKLGEYLMTGNPVVVTKVGEIEDYLTDGYDAYLAEPNNINSFAEKLILALEDKRNSKEIGIRGRENAMKNFNHNIQTKNILNFIRCLQIDKTQQYATKL